MISNSEHRVVDAKWLTCGNACSLTSIDTTLQALILFIYAKRNTPRKRNSTSSKRELHLYLTVIPPGTTICGFDTHQATHYQNQSARILNDTLIQYTGRNSTRRKELMYPKQVHLYHALQSRIGRVDSSMFRAGRFPMLQSIVQ